MSEINYYSDGERANATVLNRPLQELETYTLARTWADVRKSRFDNKQAYQVSGLVSKKGVPHALVGEEGGTETDYLFRTQRYTYSAGAFTDDAIFTGALNETNNKSINRYAYPVYNISGELTTDIFRNRLSNYGNNWSGGGDNNGVIGLPPPDDTNIGKKLRRYDLLGIEMWEERVSDRDAIFFRGLVQSSTGTSTISSLGIPDSYVAFYLGDDRAGENCKCYQWSTMSETTKQSYLENPVHRLYIHNGEVWQTRFRWRTVTDFIGLNNGYYQFYIELGATTDNKYTEYNQARFEENGVNEAVTDKWVLTAQGKEDLPTTIEYVGKDSMYTDMEIRNDQGVFMAHSKYGIDATYFVPVMKIQRNNLGTYHPIFNPHGTSSYPDHRPWWTQSTNTTDDCFQEIGYTNTFGANYTIAGNGTSFLSDIEGTITPLNGSELSVDVADMTRLTSSDTSYIPTSSSTLLTLPKYPDSAMAYFDWTLPAPKVLRKLALSVSGDWLIKKRNLMPTNFKIWGSTTGLFAGEEVELANITDAREKWTNADGVMEETASPYVYHTTIANETAYSYYRFQQLDNVQWGLEKIEMFEDVNDISNFFTSGYHGVELVNTSTGDRFPTARPKNGDYSDPGTVSDNIVNSYMSTSAGIPLNTALQIWIKGVNTGRTITFTALDSGPTISGKWESGLTWSAGLGDILSANSIRQFDCYDLRYLVGKQFFNYGY